MVAHPNTNEKVELFKNGSQRGGRTSSIESSGGSRISMKRSIIAVADVALADLPNILARNVKQNLQRTPHTSHLTPHTSHLTPHTSQSDLTLLVLSYTTPSSSTAFHATRF